MHQVHRFMGIVAIIHLQNYRILNHPLNPYASTKKNNELFAERLCATHNITLIGLRFFTVYGPWTRPDMATFNFKSKVLKMKILSFSKNNKVNGSRFYICGDVCEAIARLVQQIAECKQK
jgi:UDP-glucuronate 4-epimerase